VVLYSIGKMDMLFLASTRRAEADYNYFGDKAEATGMLDYIHSSYPYDLEAKKVADERLLDYMFMNDTNMINFDYFPILDVSASEK